MFKNIRRFLNRYIFKRKEYSEIVRKQKEIAERNRKGLQRKWIRKDVEKILDGEGLSDYLINQLVDYILEKDNK